MKLLILPLLFALGAANATRDDETKCCCTTYDTSVCLSRIHDRVDAELNATYQKAMKGLGNEDLQNLKDAERTWVAYRDAACKAEYGLWGGGSGGPNAHTMCVIRLTRQRTANLRNVYVRMNR
jgi:uncharacterized protein YecT (DUF1311 family)